VNNGGLYLQGWPVDSAGAFTSNPSDLSLLQSINVKNVGSVVSPTDTVLVDANIQRPTTWPAAATAGTAPPDFTLPMSVTDSLGSSHNVTIELRRTATPSQWSYTIKSPDVTASVGSGTLQFTNGKLDFTAAGTTATAPATLNAGKGLNLAIDWTDPDIANQTVTVDLSQLSQFGSNSVVNTINPNGAGVGSVIGVEVDKQGFVSAKFDNGEIRQIAKIGLATFPNPDGLQTVSGNAYRATSASGVFAIKEPGVGGAGQISPSSLEASTVDLSAEFTSLITTQRAYSASSKIITTADQMLEELINIKR
jgi:flagellar hook protein FlgE